jgi:hypothetical protein
LLHPKAIAVLMMISTTQFLCICVFYFVDVTDFSCLDRLTIESYNKYFLAVEEFHGAVKHEALEFESKEVHARLRMSQCKLTCSAFMSFMFTAFLPIYYMCWDEFYDDNVFSVLAYTCSLLAKTLFRSAWCY